MLKIAPPKPKDEQGNEIIQPEKQTIQCPTCNCATESKQALNKQGETRNLKKKQMKGAKENGLDMSKPRMCASTKKSKR